MILCNEDSLNDLLENDKGEYDLAIYDTDSTKLYGMLWKPLENILHKGDIVYYSTTGELGRISHEDYRWVRKDWMTIMTYGL